MFELGLIVLLMVGAYASFLGAFLAAKLIERRIKTWFYGADFTDH